MVAGVAVLSACSGSDADSATDDGTSQATEQEDAAAQEADEAGAGSEEEGTQEQDSQEGDAQASSEDTEADPSGGMKPAGADPGEESLEVLLADAQALCDALDEQELRPVVDDFVELRADEVTEVDSLCSLRDERFEVARVWVQADWSEREFLQSMAADPYEPCEISGRPAVCQSHEGDPELANGWPRVAIQVGSMGVETQAADPAVAREVAATVLDDVLAQPE
ncbi:hypothetical protein BJF80_06805 [Serinicoccus sp. CUA-874]|uniref:hypothetical protein n=1 Tax=Serinicoccus sp. CUA-874 TaxID=1517939 RepID=UPI00095FC9A9|nr:hypothetical protein [Serinicoccus sp. CUA-874]OLT16291.1 hypothetical protein BJF80_06805 [Serinicoccus sp. CUA-874]